MFWIQANLLSDQIKFNRFWQVLKCFKCRNVVFNSDCTSILQFKTKLKRYMEGRKTLGSGWIRGFGWAQVLHPHTFFNSSVFQSHTNSYTNSHNVTQNHTQNHTKSLKITKITHTITHKITHKLPNTTTHKITQKE